MKIKINRWYFVGAALVALIFFAHAKNVYASCSVVFSAQQNSGVVTPTSNSCFVENATPDGGQALTWTSSTAPGYETDWYTWSNQSGGPLSPNRGNNSTVTVTITKTNITVGTHYGRIVATGGGSDYIDITYNVTAQPCSVTAFNYAGYPSSLPYNSSATLNVTTSGCTSALISGGQYGTGTDAPTLNGVFNTNNLTSSVTYTYVATGPINTSTRTVTVPIGAACTINVNATWNGVYQTPTGGYNYTITGPSTIAGSGPAGYPQTPAAQNWTIVYTGGSSVPFTGYNNQTQSCSSAGGSITFTLAFVDGTVPAQPTPIAQNTSMNASVTCGNILVSWNSISGATSYDVFRSDNPNTVKASVGTTNWTDANVVGGPYTYSVQARNAYGASTKGISNSVSPTQCIVDISLSDLVFKSVNGANLSFSSNCSASQTGSAKVIKTGDTVKTSLCVVNNGSITANSVVVTLYLNQSNLMNPTNFVNVSGGSFSSSSDATQITVNLGSLAASGKRIVTFDSTVKANGTQSLQRIRYNGIITYSTGIAGATGCIGTSATVANPCTIDTGYAVFYNGVKSPTEKEVNP